jgi:hypothetical protein
VLLLLSENGMIVYEKFCIAEERSVYLLLCQSILIAGWILGWILGLYTKPTHILAWLIPTRLLSCVILAILVRRLLYIPINKQYHVSTTDVHEKTDVITASKNQLYSRENKRFKAQQ